jgi:hypothetical protein
VPEQPTGKPVSCSKHLADQELKMKRTMEITLLFYRRRAIKKGRAYHCPVCVDDSDLITIAEAVQLASVSRQTLYARVAGEQVHAANSSDGQLLICRNSLMEVTG